VQPFDAIDDGLELFLGGHENSRGEPFAVQRPVGGDAPDAQVEDFSEFPAGVERRPGHSRQLPVELEITLEGHGGQRPVFVRDRHGFLGLDRLVKAQRPRPVGHHSAREFVHDDDLFLVRHQVFAVALKEPLGAERLLDHVLERTIGRRRRRGRGARGRQAAGGQRHLALRKVHRVVAAFLQPQRELAREHVCVREGGLFALAVGDDQRHARLVDEDGVHLVDDRVIVSALDAHPPARRTFQDAAGPSRPGGVLAQLVAQVIEGEFLVGSVSHVGVVSRDALLVGEAVHKASHGKAQGAVDAAHPLGVAPGQVIVDGHDVHAAAGQCVEERGHGRRQRLALAGLHLGDAAAVHARGAEHLDVEMPLADGPRRRFAHARVGFRLEVPKGFAQAEALAEFRGRALQLGVGKPRRARGQRVDPLQESAKRGKPKQIGRLEKQIERHRVPSRPSKSAAAIIAGGSIALKVIV